MSVIKEMIAITCKHNATRGYLNEHGDCNVIYVISILLLNSMSRQHVNKVYVNLLNY